MTNCETGQVGRAFFFPRADLEMEKIIILLSINVSCRSAMERAIFISECEEKEKFL